MVRKVVNKDAADFLSQLMVAYLGYLQGDKVIRRALGKVAACLTSSSGARAPAIFTDVVVGLDTLGPLRLISKTTRNDITGGRVCVPSVGLAASGIVERPSACCVRPAIMMRTIDVGLDLKRLDPWSQAANDLVQIADAAAAEAAAATVSNATATTATVSSSAVAAVAAAAASASRSAT